MAKKQKLNGDLLTDDEKNSPMGLGYVSAAERLNLIYLASPEVMLKLLVQFGNEAWEFSMAGGLPKAVFWKGMNEKAEPLAIILQGKNPAYMCIPWFTDPNQMTASLRQQLEHERPDAPPGAAWRKNPVREHARSFMAFFLELSEGAIEGQGKIPDAQLSSEHIKKNAGAFLGMDPKMLQLNLGYSEDKQEPDNDDSEYP
jgi:hypothetical protein